MILLRDIRVLLLLRMIQLDCVHWLAIRQGTTGWTVGFRLPDPIFGGKGMTLQAGYIGVGLFLLRDLRGCVSEAMQ